ncbi:hypothetical protein TNCV_1258231 [Trichonephila clavipes]|nr:hypothetical protein TNCV_1258231 [Trichonephila clavipes]
MIQDDEIRLQQLDDAKLLFTHSTEYIWFERREKVSARHHPPVDITELKHNHYNAGVLYNLPQQWIETSSQSMKHRFGARIYNRS